MTLPEELLMSAMGQPPRKPFRAGDVVVRRSDGIKWRIPCDQFDNTIVARWGDIKVQEADLFDLVIAADDKERCAMLKAAACHEDVYSGELARMQLLGLELERLKVAQVQARAAETAAEEHISISVALSSVKRVLEERETLNAKVEDLLTVIQMMKKQHAFDTEKLEAEYQMVAAERELEIVALTADRDLWLSRASSRDNPHELEPAVVKTNAEERLVCTWRHMPMNSVARVMPNPEVDFLKGEKRYPLRYLVGADHPVTHAELHYIYAYTLPASPQKVFEALFASLPPDQQLRVTLHSEGQTAVRVSVVRICVDGSLKSGWTSDWWTTSSPRLDVHTAIDKMIGIIHEALSKPLFDREWAL